MDNKKNTLNIASAVLAALLWSTSYVATKMAYASFPPLTLGVCRFIIASLVLGLVMAVKKYPLKLPLKDIATMAISGVLGITIYFALQNIALNMTTAGSAALIVAAFPVITALLEFIIYRVKISLPQSFGIILAIFGVYLITGTQADGDMSGQITGNLLLIATGFVWAFYNFTARKVVLKYPAVTVSFYQTIAGTIAFIPLALLESPSWKAPDAQSILALVYLALLCSIAAFMLYNLALRKLSSGTAVNLLNLVPVFGVVFSMLFLRESLQLSQLIGGPVVIAGVFLSVMRPKRLKTAEIKTGA